MQTKAAASKSEDRPAEGKESRSAMEWLREVAFGRFGYRHLDGVEADRSGRLHVDAAEIFKARAERRNRDGTSS